VRRGRRLLKRILSSMRRLNNRDWAAADVRNFRSPFLLVSTMLLSAIYINVYIDRIESDAEAQIRDRDGLRNFPKFVGDSRICTQIMPVSSCVS